MNRGTNDSYRILFLQSTMIICKYTKENLFKNTIKNTIKISMYYFSYTWSIFDWEKSRFEKLFKADVTLFEEFLDRFKEKFAQRVKQGGSSLIYSIDLYSIVVVVMMMLLLKIHSRSPMYLSFQRGWKTALRGSRFEGDATCCMAIATCQG